MSRKIVIVCFLLLVCGKADGQTVEAIAELDSAEESHNLAQGAEIGLKNAIEVVEQTEYYKGSNFEAQVQLLKFREAILKKLREQEAEFREVKEKYAVKARAARQFLRGY